MKVNLITNLTPEDITELRLIIKPDSITLRKESIKGSDLHHILTIVFDEFNASSLLRDIIIEKTVEHTFLKIRSYFQKKKEEDYTVAIDDEIYVLGKRLFLNISCHIDQLPGIYKQIEIKLTPHIQGLIPNGSTLIVSGWNDRTSINILVIETGSGKEYSL